MSEILTYSSAIPSRAAAERPSTTSSRDTAAFLKLAHQRFQQAYDADRSQRERELEDLKFYAGEQWPEEIKAARAGQAASAGLPPMPARPCLTIDKTREAIRQVLNAERQADMGIELVPSEDFGELGSPIDDAEIETREGLIRRIQRESQAADARTWAFARSTIAGRGYYGVMTRYVEGKSWDQEIYIQRFYNQSSVSLDPAHEQPDGSDAEWAFAGTELPWDQYRALFPDQENGASNRVSAAADDDEFRALGEEAPGWFTREGETRMCRVVDYYYTERTTRELVKLETGQVAWRDELPAGVTVQESRRVVTKAIKWAKLDGVQILEETDWPGHYLPIVKVMGEELQPYDRERRAEGMIRPARDSQRGLNFMVSKWVEMIGLAPLPPWMMAAGQDEGFEAEYAAANTRTLPVLHYNQVDLDGRQAPIPFRTNVDVPIGPIAASVQMFNESIQSTTGMHDPSLGRVDPALKSGKAIQLIQDKGQRGTSNYLDNLARSLRYEGQIINDLLYPIYGQRPDRIAQLVTGEGESQSVQLRPRAMPGQVSSQGAMPPPPTNGQKIAHLTPDAKFNVIVKVTQAYTSRRDQEAAIIGNLISNDPQLMTWFGDLFFKNQDGPGHTEMAERVKVMLAPPIQAILQSKEQGQPAVPPQVQQQLAQGQQALQQLQQALQQAQQQLQTQAVKAHADIQREQISADKEIRLQTMKDATAIAVARIAASTKIGLATQEAQEEAIALAQTQTHDAIVSGQDRAHEAALHAADQQHQQQQAQQAQQAQQQQALQTQQQLPSGLSGGAGPGGPPNASAP